MLMKMSSQDEKVEYIAKPTSPNLCCSTDHLSCFTCKITQVLYAQVLLSISLLVQLVGGATHDVVCACGAVQVHTVAEKGHSILPITTFPILSFPI